MKDLKNDILKIGAYAEEAIYNSVEALKNRDKVLAKNVIDSDVRVDELELVIDEKCIGTSHIALGNPPDPEKIGGGAWWQSKGHIDCVIKKINLYVDDKQVLKDGKLLDDNI